MANVNDPGHADFIRDKIDSILNQLGELSKNQRANILKQLIHRDISQIEKIDYILNQLGELSKYQRAKILKQLIHFDTPEINEYKMYINGLEGPQVENLKKELNENEFYINKIIEQIKNILKNKEIKSLNTIQIDTLFTYLDDFFEISELKAFEKRLRVIPEKYNPIQLSNKLNKMKSMSSIELRTLNIDELLQTGGKKSTSRKIKKVRKHQGIYQKAPKKGKLKPGFKYSGKKTKTGLKVIVKVSK